MNRILAAALFASASMLCLPAQAGGIDDAIKAFAAADGFAAENVDSLDAKLLEAFIVSGAMRPDGAASPLEKALLLVDAVEPALPRTRTMLRYGQMFDDETPYSFITVERYNFGPLFHQSVSEEYGAENTGALEDFGVGPHVAWRIVTMPMMGQTAAIVSASRKEISDEEARAADCNGRSCLSFDALPDYLQEQEWQEVTPEVAIASAYPDRSEDDVAVPASAAAELSVAAALAEGSGGEPQWNGPEHPEAARGSAPFLFVSIDRDFGQDTNSDAMLGLTLLNDDAVEELWFRRVEFPGSPANWTQAAKQRTR